VDDHIIILVKTGWIIVPMTAFTSTVSSESFIDAIDRAMSGDFGVVKANHPEGVWPPPPTC